MLETERVEKFKYRLVKPYADQPPFFVGVALLKSGGIDFYYNFARSYSYRYNPKNVEKFKDWTKKPPEDLSSLNVSKMKCVDIEIDFNNMYCKFDDPVTGHTYTYRCSNRFKSEISMAALIPLTPFVDFTPMNKREMLMLPTKLTKDSQWFAMKHCMQSSVSNYCAIYS